MWVGERVPPGKSGSPVKGQGSEELPSQQQPWRWKAVGTAPGPQRSPAAAPARRPRSSKPGKAHRAPRLRRLSEDAPSRASRRPAEETKHREPGTHGGEEPETAAPSTGCAPCMTPHLTPPGPERFFTAV